MTDLRITASTGIWDDTKNKWIEYKDTKGKANNPIARLARLDDFTILCLFECALAEVWQIKLAQPPHQQRYAAAEGFTYDSSGNMSGVTFEARHLYMQNAPGKENPEWTVYQPGTGILPDTAKTFLDTNTRCIFPDVMAKKINELLTTPPNPNYTDSIPNSAELGIELNDPSCESTILRYAQGYHFPSYNPY